MDISARVWQDRRRIGKKRWASTPTLRDWVKAGELHVGERVGTMDGSAAVESIAARPGQQRVYNLNVEADHRYLVAGLGVVVHNAKRCWPRNQTPSNDLSKQTLGRTSSSRVLDRNLKAAGVSRPDGAATHHIVAGNDQRAATARAVLRREGIDINEAANGVYLPKSSSAAAPPTATHSRINTNRYQERVQELLENAPTGTVRGVLATIRQQLLDGEFPY